MSKVLLVDDEPRVLRALTAALELDHDIYTSGSAREAQALIKTGAEFDVIVSDQLMPEMKGNELLNWCKSFAPKSRRMMLTGLPMTDDLKRQIDDVEVVPIFKKPWNIDEINEYLTKCGEVKRNFAMVNKTVNSRLVGNTALVFESSVHYQSMCSNLAPKYFNNVIQYSSKQEFIQGLIDHADAAQIIININDGSVEEQGLLRQIYKRCQRARILITGKPSSMLALERAGLKKDRRFQILPKPFFFERLSHIVRPTQKVKVKKNTRL